MYMSCRSEIAISHSFPVSYSLVVVVIVVHLKKYLIVVNSNTFSINSVQVKSRYPTHFPFGIMCV
jgi:hypothetical protein